MSNVLSEEKKQQVIALGKLGWTLRRIEQATGVRRETAGAYLKAAGIMVRQPGGWGRRVVWIKVRLIRATSPPIFEDMSARRLLWLTRKLIGISGGARIVTTGGCVSLCPAGGCAPGTPGAGEADVANCQCTTASLKSRSPPASGLCFSLS